MNPENAQTMGIVLTIVGLALSLIGYVIYLNLREGKSEDEEGEQKADVPDDEPEWAADLSDEVLVRAYSDDKVDSQSDEMSSENEGVEPSGPRQTPGIRPTREPEYLTVATILRQVESGELKIRVNQKDYETVDQLRMTNDWPKINRMSKDLLGWLDKKQPASTPPAGLRMETSSEPPTDESVGMISQINSIIEEKIKGSDSDQPSIRLVEGIGGVLNVYVGVERYLLDEVPFEEVRSLIRESVAEWEAAQ